MGCLWGAKETHDGTWQHKNPILPGTLTSSPGTQYTTTARTTTYEDATHCSTRPPAITYNTTTSSHPGEKAIIAGRRRAAVASAAARHLAAHGLVSESLPPVTPHFRPPLRRQPPLSQSHLFSLRCSSNIAMRRSIFRHLLSRPRLLALSRPASSFLLASSAPALCFALRNMSSSPAAAPSPVLKKPLKMALIQLASGADKAANLEHAASQVAKAAASGSKLVVLPECFNSPYGTNFFPDYAEVLLPTPDSKKAPSYAALSNMAKDNKVFLVSCPSPRPHAPLQLPPNLLTLRLLGRRLHPRVQPLDQEALQHISDLRPRRRPPRHPPQGPPLRHRHPRQDHLPRVGRA